MSLLVMIGSNVIAMDRPKAPSRARRLLVAAIFVALGLATLALAIVTDESSASRLILWVAPS
jgi:hypothetical protein